VAASADRARSALAARLQNRRGEIEDAIVTRIHSISSGGDEEWLAGVRATVATALDHAILVIERGEGSPLPVPVQVLAQTRLAARSGISLDTVLRRYFAGYTLLGDFIVHESEGFGFRERWLKQLLREQAGMFDRLLTTISEEYRRELQAQPASSEARRVEKVKRLLRGELLESSDLGYSFDGYHLGLVAAGSGADEILRDLAAELDRRLLVVRPDESTVWGWLGGREPLAVSDVFRHLEGREEPARRTLAIGDPSPHLAGWRLTHRQAAAAHRIGCETGEGRVGYASVALVATVLQDGLLTEWLRRRILPALAEPSATACSMQETVRAFLDSGQNLSSAAARLEISRHTVAKRLRTLEQRVGEPLQGITAELEIALRLLEFDEKKHGVEEFRGANAAVLISSD